MAQAQPTTTQPHDTVFDALVASLQGAAAYNRDDIVPPAAILWTDERREWESLVPRLRVVLSQFLTLGAYDRPVAWVRLSSYDVSWQGVFPMWPSRRILCRSSTCRASTSEPRPRMVRSRARTSMHSSAMTRSMTS